MTPNVNADANTGSSARGVTNADAADQATTQTADASADGSPTNWTSLLSEDGLNLRESEIRALFAVVSRPEVVSLAGGMPNLRDLPLNDIGEMTAKLIATDGMRALQYGNGHGWDPLREQVLEVMAKEGIVGDAQRIQITTGSQQALQLVSEILVDAGDVVLAESPSYVGALGVFRSRRADVQHVEMDSAGLVSDALRETISRLRAEGKKIKFLYTIPNFHNPAGISMSDQRRQEIVDICRSEGVLIVEDNPYGLLGFEREPVRALQTLWPEGVVYLGSFSKIFAPGYRIGWALAPEDLYEKLVLAAESDILSPSMMGQMSIKNYLSEFDWYSQVRQFAKMYQGRWEAMDQALKQEMPEGCEWTTPTGGFYTWVKLPPGIDSKEMLPRAVEGLVAYVPGTAFYYDGRGRDHMRLSFCYPPEETIREGVRRLGVVLRKEMARAQG